MAYDSAFFAMYERYLQETTVRENHDLAFRLFMPGETRGWGYRVLDLGCGSSEYLRYARNYPMDYVGIDRSRAPLFPEGEEFIQADYMDPSAYDNLPFVPDSFVSLFSVEACYPAAQRYELYRMLFQKLPSVRQALVAGFYYASKRDQETIGETGGIVSYQTIEDPYDFVCDEFEERRLLLRTPSVMFGNDVVEVWKHLVRKT